MKTRVHHSYYGGNKLEKAPLSPTPTQDIKVSLCVGQSYQDPLLNGTYFQADREVFYVAQEYVRNGHLM
jgi:hypothetical protein